MEPTVINLADIELTTQQVQLLSYGLSYIPTHNTTNNINEGINQHINGFIKNIKTQYFFRHIHTPRPSFSIKRLSSWEPPAPDHVELNSLISELMEVTKERPLNICPFFHDNITSEERQTLETLLHMKDIVIKPADKSRCFTIMNKTDYINKVESLLQDTNTYKEVPQDHTKEVADDIDSYLTYIKYKHNMDYRMINQLKAPKKPRTSQFYIIPKCHKEGNPPRPIVSACDYSTCNISEYITQLITPIAKRNPSYLGSTKEFINSIKSLPKFSPRTILVTADVSNMYTNIPLDEGIQSIITAIENNHTEMPKHTPHKRVIKMFLKFILKDNYFQFRDKFYLQTQGVAMGCKIAPAFANIFMAELEKDMLSQYTWNIYLWKRYIDDIFFIWQKGMNKLKTFMNHCNAFHPTIKFTFEYSTKAINFLDVTVYKNKVGCLETTLYKKPTHKNTYVHYTSNHPVHMFRNIIYTQVLRLKLINSNVRNLNIQIKELITAFKNRGYPHKLILNTVLRAIKIPRDTLLGPKKTVPRDKHQLRCKMIHSIHSKYYRQRIQNIWHKNIKSQSLKQIWPNNPKFVMVNQPNLQKLLVRARTK